MGRRRRTDRRRVGIIPLEIGRTNLCEHDFVFFLLLLLTILSGSHACRQMNLFKKINRKKKWRYMSNSAIQENVHRFKSPQFSINIRFKRLPFVDATTKLYLLKKEDYSSYPPITVSPPPSRRSSQVSKTDHQTDHISSLYFE